MLDEALRTVFKLPRWHYYSLKHHSQSHNFLPRFWVEPQIKASLIRLQDKSRRLLEVGEPSHGSTKIVTSDAVQVRLIQSFITILQDDLKWTSSGTLKAGSNACMLITITRQQGESSCNCMVKIKSRRLLEVGEPNHGSTKIVTSDALQVRLMRIFITIFKPDLSRISSGIFKAGSNACMLLNIPR